MEARLVERARIVLGCLEGKPITTVAESLNVRPNTVIDWRRRFEAEGIAGLQDRPRSGKPPRYTEKFRKQLLATLEELPPKGQAVWDGPALAKHLKTSVHAVWRVLRKEGICLARQRSWCVSTDAEFAAKAADIVGLYLNPPQNALVLSVDEKPSIQALERKTGSVETDNGKIVRGFKSTYKRHGTLNLFAALEVATGAVHTQTTGRKRRIEFLDFMDRVVADLPAGKEIHVILDNYCIHKKNDAWSLDVSRLSLQRLNTGLFIHGKNQRILRRIQVQTHDVGGLGCELRICADAPTALPCLTYAFFPQHSPDRVHRRFQMLRQCWPVPHGLSLRRRFFQR